MESKKEQYLIICGNEIIVRTWCTLRDICKTLTVFKNWYPNNVVILAKVVIAEDEL